MPSGPPLLGYEVAGTRKLEGGEVVWHTQATLTVIGDERERWDEVIAVATHANRDSWHSIDMSVIASYRLRREDLEWREVEGEIVALDLSGSIYFSLNRTATALWPSLLKGATREQLVARLCSAFDADQASAGRDVDVFLESLRKRGLLAG